MSDQIPLFDLERATPLEAGLYGLCRELQELPGSVLMTRIEQAMSLAMHELWRLRHQMEHYRKHTSGDTITSSQVRAWAERLRWLKEPMLELAAQMDAQAARIAELEAKLRSEVAQPEPARVRDDDDVPLEGAVLRREYVAMRSQVRALEAERSENKSIIEAIVTAIQGGKVSEFMESFEVVRKVADLQQIIADQKILLDNSESALSAAQQELKRTKKSLDVLKLKHIVENKGGLDSALLIDATVIRMANDELTSDLEAERSRRETVEQENERLKAALHSAGMCILLKGASR